MLTPSRSEDVFPCLPADLDRVQQRLTPHVERRPDLTEALRHLFGGVPKLVRPMLALMSAYLVGDPHRPVDERVVAAAAAVELLHVGTMCHDDVMDEADTRRGRPSVNARWGNVQAILGGDHLLAAASELAAGLGAAEAGIVAGTLRALVDGQMMETADLFDGYRTEESYYAAITGKTAALLACACRLGALEAGGDEPAVEALAQFGLELGIAFQINDDVLDLVQTEQHLGKPAGKDLVEGVYTLPVILAARRAPGLYPRLAGPMSAGEAEQLRADVVAAGGCEAASKAAAQHLEQAVRALEGAVKPGPERDGTIAFGGGLLNAVGIADAGVGASLFYGHSAGVV
ncbi:MAG TPA: polyprenyl synthetase family protein [Micromonosporaceae bacterium]|nr:polyprenyl synthetase family protein [Micromonosporaceae bacterium]